MEDITRKSPLRLPSLALRNLRLLLRPIRDFELRVEEVHAAFGLGVGGGKGGEKKNRSQIMLRPVGMAEERHTSSLL